MHNTSYVIKKITVYTTNDVVLTIKSSTFFNMIVVQFIIQAVIVYSTKFDTHQVNHIIIFTLLMTHQNPANT
jgi:hypothetical protein